MNDPNLKTEMMDWNGCLWVESVPDRMHGTPVVVDTRMDADGILVNFDEGMSPVEIVEDFGVPLEAVLGILDFSGRATARDAA